MRYHLHNGLLIPDRRVYRASVGRGMLPVGNRHVPFGDPSASSLTDFAAYWPLGEASGTRNDSSANALHLTDNNTVTQRAGKVGNAASFDANNSEWLNVADNVPLSGGDRDITAAGWVLMDLVNSSRFVFGKWLATGNQREWMMTAVSSTGFRVYYTATGSIGGNLTASTFGSITTATWYFVVFQHDSVNNLIKIAINNGAFDTAAHTTGLFDSTADFEVGRGLTKDGFVYHHGGVDELGFWGRILTADELTYLYNSGNGRTYNSGTGKFE